MLYPRSAATDRQPAAPFRFRNTWLPTALTTLLFAHPLAAQELRATGAQHVVLAMYDALRDRVVAHGHDGMQAEWDGTNWRASPNARPVAPRAGYIDPTNGRTYLLAPPTPWLAPPYSIDVRTGDDWSTFSPSNAPSPRSYAAYAFDEARRELVMFGGLDAGTIGDTWAFDGQDWSQRTPANAPSPRFAATMGYDAARQRVVLFGGASLIGSLDDTWEWDGTTWAQVATAQQPSPRTTARMTYDSARQVMVLVGGSTGSGFSSECWEYDGQNWTQVASAPPVFATAPIRGAAYHAGTAETLVIGAGFDSFALAGDVYAWNGATWSQRPDLGQPHAVDPESALTNNPFGPGQLIYGGSPNGSPGGPASNELWSFDGSDFTLVDTTGPLLRNPAMWTLNGSVYVFGTDAATLAPATWLWNGVAWSQLPGTQPTGDFPDRLVTVDTSANLVRMGFNWSFDGASWQQYSAFVPPYDVYDYCLAFDPVRNVTVAYGGEAWQGGQFPGPGIPPLSPLYLVYEFDGTQWTWSQPTGGPTNSIGAMAFDARLAAVVFTGAEFGTELWSYDGAWTSLNAIGTIGNGAPLTSIDPMAATDGNGEVLFVDVYGARELVLEPAETETYGAGCGASVPVLGTNSRAESGNVGFTLELVDVPPGTIVAIAGATSQAAIPVLGCTLLVAPDVATWAGMSSPTGLAPLPIPNAPTLVGAELFFQPFALLAASPAGIAFGRGLRVQIGN